MSLRRMAISRKFAGHRYAIINYDPISSSDAKERQILLRRAGISTRIIRTKQGYWIYRYPQY